MYVSMAPACLEPALTEQRHVVEQWQTPAFTLKSGSDVHTFETTDTLRLEALDMLGFRYAFIICQGTQGRPVGCTSATLPLEQVRCLFRRRITEAQNCNDGGWYLPMVEADVTLVSCSFLLQCCPPFPS